MSLPTHSPVAVASMSNTPTPRSRPGFQDSGRPVAGSSAAMPSRGTAPGPAASPASGLFAQRKWPPTYTAVPLIATAYVVSPPVTLRHTGTWPGFSLVRSQRVWVSHGLVWPPYAPVVDTTA